MGMTERGRTRRSGNLSVPDATLAALLMLQVQQLHTRCHRNKQWSVNNLFARRCSHVLGFTSGSLDAGLESYDLHGR